MRRMAIITRSRMQPNREKPPCYSLAMEPFPSVYRRRILVYRFRWRASSLKRKFNEHVSFIKDLVILFERTVCNRKLLSKFLYSAKTIIKGQTRRIVDKRYIKLKKIFLHTEYTLNAEARKTNIEKRIKTWSVEIRTYSNTMDLRNSTWLSQVKLKEEGVVKCK